MHKASDILFASAKLSHDRISATARVLHELGLPHMIYENESIKILDTQVYLTLNHDKNVLLSRSQNTIVEIPYVGAQTDGRVTLPRTKEYTIQKSTITTRKSILNCQIYTCLVPCRIESTSKYKISTVET